MDVDGGEIYAINSPYAGNSGGACGCVLCEYADDTGGAMAYLKQMDTALGGRTDDKILASMMCEAYKELFYTPLRSRDMDVPSLDASTIERHFTEHDINPLRVLRRDMVRLQRLQDAAGDAGDTRQWSHLGRMKMDLVRQYEQTDSRTSRELPAPPHL